MKNKPLLVPVIIIVICGSLFGLFKAKKYLSLKFANLPSKTNITKTVLKQQPGFISHGSRNNPKIALTFDADMTPYMLEELKTGKVSSYYNQKIVEILEKEKVPSTIFMAGMWAEKYPEVAKQLAQNPLFEIANHSYSHPGFTNQCYSLPSIPKWGKDGEFQKSQDAIEKNTGVRPTLFRFPGGCHSEEDIKTANKYGLTVVDWDAASNDSFNNNLSSVVNNVKNRTQNGSIIVFHFHGNKNAPLSAEALEIVIPYLKNKGFQFVKVSDLISGLDH